MKFLGTMTAKPKSEETDPIEGTLTFRPASSTSSPFGNNGGTGLSPETAPGKSIVGRGLLT